MVNQLGYINQPLEILLVVSVDPQKKVVSVMNHTLRLGGSKFERPYDLYDLGTISSGAWDAVTAEAPNH